MEHDLGVGTAEGASVPREVGSQRDAVTLGRLGLACRQRGERWGGRALTGPDFANWPLSVSARLLGPLRLEHTLSPRALILVLCSSCLECPSISSRFFLIPPTL